MRQRDAWQHQRGVGRADFGNVCLKQWGRAFNCEKESTRPAGPVHTPAAAAAAGAASGCRWRIDGQRTCGPHELTHMSVPVNSRRRRPTRRSKLDPHGFPLPDPVPDCFFTLVSSPFPLLLRRIRSDPIFLPPQVRRRRNRFGSPTCPPPIIITISIAF